MPFNAKNGTVQLDGTDMDYIRFGYGINHLVILPGLGDGLQTVKGTAIPMAVMYRIFAKDYTVWAFSRKNVLRSGCTTRDMARDQAQAMQMLGIARADVFGVSMGGMIAQHLAIDFPEKVAKLVLTVTCPRPNPILEESIGEWVDCAKRGDHTALMDSNLRRIYSEGYYRKNKWLVPVMGKLTKPKSYERFLIQAEACLRHDAYEKLPLIRAKTLVIGGEKDLALGGDASRKIAARIPSAKLRMYDQWGHGVYEEARDFNRTVLDFLTSPVLYRETEKVLRSLVRFELATEDDARTIIELRKQIWATTYRGFYPDSMIDNFDYGWHLKKELQRIRSHEYRVYRIVKGDRNIGYLSTRMTDVVMLQSLYILEEYQHQGIGRMAFGFVKQYCREKGADSFVCHCLPENWNARKFYEKMGGEILGEDMDNEESWMNSVIYRFEIR